VLTVLALEGCSASFTAVDSSSSADAASPSMSATQGPSSTNFGSATPFRFGAQYP
jgi:hypothetical protein